MMKLLFPSLDRSRWREYVLLSLMGVGIAGVYGIVHDQVTYTLSAEYYTEVKFKQFFYANMGAGPRVFAGTVGFLATWWVGLIVGWFLARLAVPRFDSGEVRKAVVRGFAVVFGGGLTGGLSGYLFGLWQTRDGVPAFWRQLVRELEIERAREFIVVANIHNFGYLGAFLGLIVAGVMIARRSKRTAEAVG
jgi:hypothetical protein